MPTNAIFIIMDNYGDDVGDWYYTNIEDAQDYISENELEEIQIVKFVRLL